MAPGGAAPPAAQVLGNVMWSGFNLIANLAAWRSLPEDIRSSIEKRAARAVRLQRRFNDVDTAPFRAKLAGVYADWKNILGARCWNLLEADVGRLG